MGGSGEFRVYRVGIYGVFKFRMDVGSRGIDVGFCFCGAVSFIRGEVGGGRGRFVYLYICVYFFNFFVRES